MNKIFKFLLISLGLAIVHGCKDDSFPVPPATTEPRFSYVLSNNEFAPSTATFTNESIVPDRAGTVTYYWNFGDSTSSQEINPTHVYNRAGAFIVNLVVVTSESLEINELSKTVIVKDANASGSPIFFTNGTTIYSGLINSNPPVFSSLNIPGVQSSYGMTLDTVNSKIYITDFDAGKIYRTDYDGTNKIDFRTGIGAPDAAIIDYANNKIYFDTDAGVRRANLSDPTVNQFEEFATGQTNDPEGLAIDPVNHKIYWNTYNGGVWSKNLDGTNEKEIIPGTGGGGAIIVVNNRIFYDDYNASADIQIKSANLDGTGISTVTTGISRVVYGLAYDPTGNKLYWGDRTPGIIKQSNLDGSNAVSWFTLAGSSPRGIVIGKKK
jgi:PKD repeat protein